MLEGKRKFILSIIGIVSVLILALASTMPFVKVEGIGVFSTAIMFIGGIVGAQVGFQGMVDKAKLKKV